MKRLVLLALVAIAAWYAYTHWPQIVSRTPSHEAVIQNSSGKVMLRVRLTVDGQTFVKERLEDGGQASFPFKVARDATFELEWDYETTMGTHHWTGGQVPKGPMVQRHVFQVDQDDQVIYEARPKGVAAPSM